MTLLNRLALMASLAALVAVTPSASFADGSTRRAAGTQGERQVELGEDLTQLRQELVRTQRSVREALVDAALTTDQMSRAFALIQNFTENYTAAVETNDPMISELTYDELYDGKIGEPLQRRFGLTGGETEYLRVQVGQWVTGELVIRDSVRLSDTVTGGK